MRASKPTKFLISSEKIALQEQDQAKLSRKLAPLENCFRNLVQYVLEVNIGCGRVLIGVGDWLRATDSVLMLTWKTKTSTN